MKSIKITLGTGEYYLSLTASAKFEIDKLCGKADVTDIIGPDTPEAFDSMCRVLAIMIEQTELARRYMGYDKGDIPTPEEIQNFISMTMTVGDIREMKRDIYNAIILGYGREISDDAKEVDLVLQELEKKTAD